MIRSGQLSNSSKISSMSILTARFRKILSKLNKLCWWQSQTEVFPVIKGTYSKIKDLIWLFFQTCLRFHPCPTFLQVSEKSDQIWMSYADDKVKHTFFKQLRVCNSKIMIPSARFQTCTQIPSMSTLSASFRQIWSQLNELHWWQNQTEAYSAIKGT